MSDNSTVLKVLSSLSLLIKFPKLASETVLATTVTSAPLMLSETMLALKTLSRIKLIFGAAETF